MLIKSTNTLDSSELFLSPVSKTKVPHLYSCGIKVLVPLKKIPKGNLLEEGL